MNQFGHVFLCLTFFLISAAHGQTSPACTPEAIKFTGIEGRGGRVTFPDGRTFEVIGHEHGDRNLQAAIINALATPELDDDTSLNKARPAMDQLAETLKEYREDLRYLENYLSAQKASVLWEESSENALARFRPLLNAGFSLRSDPRFEDAKLMAAGPSLFLEQKQKLPTNTGLLGVENITPEIAEGWQKAEDLRKSSLTFAEIKELDPKAFSAVAPLIETWDQWLENAESDKLLQYDPAEIDNAVEKIGISGQVNDSLKKRLRAYLLDHQTSMKRDISNAQTILAQNHSGLFFVGRLHLVPTLALLIEKCEASR